MAIMSDFVEPPSDDGICHECGLEYYPRSTCRCEPHCDTCEDIEEMGGFGPSHNGSPRCESGSIASGGTRAHCTCDTCF